VVEVCTRRMERKLLKGQSISRLSKVAPSALSSAYHRCRSNVHSLLRLPRKLAHPYSGMAKGHPWVTPVFEKRENDVPARPLIKRRIK